MSSKIDSDLQKSLKKACSIEETAPKRKHVRACILYTWDTKSSRAVFQTLKSLPLANDEVQLFKSLIVLHKIIQEGHPSAVKEAIREKDWIHSLGRIHPGSATYGKLIREYVNYLVLKLNFHQHHRGFNNGMFEYEEYVSLVAVADPDDGYETILDLMSLQDSLDDLAQIIFASIQADSLNTECRISALIPLIAESYGIYKFVTSMLRAMHIQLNDPEGDEALRPLEERYDLQHARLFELYADCSSIKFLTTLVTIPKLPTTPPNLNVTNDEGDETSKEIKFQRKSPVKKAPSTASVNRVPSSQNLSNRNASTASFMTPVATASAAAAMIPTVTAAAMMATPTAMMSQQYQQQQQPDFWVNQQAQYANEQARLEQERQLQLQQQQAQQQAFQQQLQQAQNDMMQMQLQQQNQHQTDLIALTDQHDKDQTLLSQYDQRVQQLENEIKTMDQNVSQQIANKDEQMIGLQDQLTVWEKKYDSLAKLYSQLRQEHLNLLPKFKKLQMKVNSAQESIKEKEQIENKLKNKDLQLAQLIKERDRAQLELERNKSLTPQQPQIDESTLAKVNMDKLIPILDAVLESGINTIQESIYNLDSPMSWSGPLSPPSFILSLVEGTSEKATDFATKFNDLIVDGIVDGDQISVILGISEFSNSVATLVTNCKASLLRNIIIG